MVYNQYITRAGDWIDSAAHPISAAEWTRFAADHPGIGPDIGNGPMDHVFTCRDGSKAYLTWTDGRIQVRGTYADDKDLAALAAQVPARLLGDEGEEYDQDGQPIEPSEPRPPMIPPGF